MSLPVISAALISNVYSAIPIGILRQVRPFGAPMLVSVPFAYPFDLDAGAIYCRAVVCLHIVRGDKEM
jgi:hypothetical protein